MYLMQRCAKTPGRVVMFKKQTSRCPVADRSTQLSAEEPSWLHVLQKTSQRACRPRVICFFEGSWSMSIADPARKMATRSTWTRIPLFRVSKSSSRRMVISATRNCSSGLFFNLAMSFLIRYSKKFKQPVGPPRQLMVTVCALLYLMDQHYYLK